MKNKLIIFSLLALIPFTGHCEDLDIPVVPVSVAKKDLNPIVSGAPELNNQAVSQALKAPSLNKNSVVTVQPGVNELFPIAISHLNRIVTPFEQPIVNTGADSETTSWETQQNVIYIGTQSETPITLFITEKGSEETAISVTLVPQKIPPREITLRAKGNINSPVSSTKSKKFEQAQPYLNTIVSMLSTLAKGGIPPGYAISSPTGVLPACRQNGIDVQFGMQTISGHNFTIHVGLARNNTSEVIEFDEDACSDWDIAAVAAFPNLVLEPGQKTEVYVVQKKNYQQEITPQRQSLVGHFND